MSDPGLTLRGLPRQRAARGEPIAERIMRHSTTDEAGCWIWTAAINTSGYARLQVDGKLRAGHRLSYEAFIGPIPDGLQIDHLCSVRNCVNPSHLEPVTPLENTRRAPAHHGRHTNCPQGHKYTPENTYRTALRRHCRTCRVAYHALWMAMTPEQRADRKAAGLLVVDLAAHFAAQSSEETAA